MILTRSSKSKFAVFILGFMAGALIWIMSPKITGQAEPWDAMSGYYWISLAIAGLLVALPAPKYFWLAPTGIYLGQIIYAFAFLPFGPLWAVGMVFTATYSLLALAGASLTFAIWRALTK